MADWGFDAECVLQPLGVELNMPPGRYQLDEKDMVETKRVASLRIQVERAIERIKNYHFFLRIPASLACVADQAFLYWLTSTPHLHNKLADTDCVYYHS